MTSTAGMPMPANVHISLCALGSRVGMGSVMPKSELKRNPQMTAKMPPIANTPASAPRPPFLPLFLNLSQPPPSIMRSP